MKYLSWFLLSFYIFIAGCSEEKEQVFILGNFIDSYANIQLSQGNVLVNGEFAYQNKLLSASDVVSVGQGQVILKHSNGSKITSLANSKIIVNQNHLSVTSGRSLIEFPPEITTEIMFKNWKIRGKNSLIDVISDKSSIINIIKGEVSIEKDGKRFIVTEGKYVTLANQPQIGNLKWWDNPYSTENFDDYATETLIPGQGVLGGRKAGLTGKAYISLVVSSMKIKVKIIGDLVITEVKQEFFNPHDYTLEGIYRFKTPKGAIINDFAVDRHGKLVHAKIKEKQLAKQAYTSQVYAGSKEDPALLEWEGNEKYKAYIYPIYPGTKRTILIKYSSWLNRNGKTKGIRYYKLPLIGKTGVSPEFGDFSLSVDLRKSNAQVAKANLGVQPNGGFLSFSASDFSSSTDFHLELFDDGIKSNRVLGWYSSPAGRSGSTHQKGDYIFLRLKPFNQNEIKLQPLSVVFLIDVSADISEAEFNVARYAVEKVVQTLSPNDQIAIVTGDMAIRENFDFSSVKNSNTIKMLESLSFQQKEGATDLWNLLKNTAKKFEKIKKNNIPIIIYIGNGKNTIGETSGKIIAEKWNNLPYDIILKALITNEGIGINLFKQITGEDPFIISEPSSVHLLKKYFFNLRKPVLENVKITFDSQIGKKFPLDNHNFLADQTIEISGTLISGKLPSKLMISGQLQGKNFHKSYIILWNRFLEDQELKYRWAKTKLKEFTDSGATPEEIMDLGLRYKLITPYTSLYVPSETEEAKATKEADETEEAKVAKEDTVKYKAKTKGRGNAIASTTASAPPRALGGRGIGDKFGKISPKPSKRRKYKYKRRKYKSKRRKYKSVRKYRRKYTDTSESFKKTSHYAQKSKPTIQYKKEASRRVSKVEIPVYIQNKKFSDKNNGLKTLKDRVSPGYFSHTTSPINITTKNVFIISQNPWKNQKLGCSLASKFPLWQRRQLWKESLGNASISDIVSLFLYAKKSCEIPTLHSGMVFLRLSISQLGNIKKMIKLYKKLGRVLSYSERRVYLPYLQNAIVSSISNLKDLLYIKKTLGLSSITEKNKIEEMLSNADDENKEKILVSLLKNNKFNLWLSQKLINLYEKSKQQNKLIRLISTYFGQPLLDDYLRLQATESLIRIKKIETARRLLSESVEFYPKNPEKRKLLGRLYRGFGWHKRALREFLTLTNLTHNSYKSKLWLALSYKDNNKYELSVKTIETILNNSDPNEKFSKLVRLFACLELAELKLKTPKLKTKLNKRAQMSSFFRKDETVKILLIFDKPYEYYSFLWGPTTTELLNVPFAKPEWGIYGIIKSSLPTSIILKIKPVTISEQGSNAKLIILLNEGTPDEKIIIKPLKFKSDTEYNFKFENQKLSEF